MKAKKHALAGMPFDEALERLIQTKPDEVKPPPGQKRKVSKAAKRLAKKLPLAQHPTDHTENRER
jgi:hypothetical protein